MPRPPRRRLLRSALALLLLFAVVVAVAQLAGVAGRGARPGTALVFDGTHERWLVKAPGAASGKRLARAAERLGGGKAGGELAGDWYEVRLGDDVAAAEAEAAFGDAGATEVEPVLPREPYVDEPGSHDDPAPAPATMIRAGDEPQAIDDPPSAVAPRTGPVGAPRLAEQWGLGQASDRDIDAPEAWQSSTGAGVIVAVIDTGVDATHPDLTGRVLEGRDFSGATTPATVDRVGHGTAIAGVIAGNGTNIAGVAPDARILPLKVYRDSAVGFSMSGYLSAIRYAADQGADVINISLGCGGSTACFSQAELEAISYATDRGALVVTAAGNTANDNDSPSKPDFPSGYELPGILSVTSVAGTGAFSTWASYGALTVDLAAPGEDILVAAPGGLLKTSSGTSFSAPHASGVAALVAASSPDVTPADMRSRIMAAAVAEPSLAGRAVTGGVLNAAASVGPGAAHAITGGGATSAQLSAPRSGALVGTPPVLTWTLPAGWSSSRVLLRLGNDTFDQPVGPGARALAHPTDAWRSGTYSWRVVARDRTGRVVTTAERTYRVAPRLNAWVTSGRLRSGGSVVRLRVGYAATEPRAVVKVVVKVGSRVVHAGRSQGRTTHARGTGSPRRGWFSYEARLSRTIRAGERISVSVQVAAGGATVTRTFRATVS